MSDERQQLAADDPLQIAYDKYKQTAEYKNSRKWASQVTVSQPTAEIYGIMEHPHLAGALFAMFVAGWQARLDFDRRVDQKFADDIEATKVDTIKRRQALPKTPPWEI